MTEIVEDSFRQMKYTKETKSVTKPKIRKRKKFIITVSVAGGIILLLYFFLINFLVSAALVPSFMEKLKAFERITEDSYAAQVQTSDIQVNRQLALNETNAWLETVESRLISVIKRRRLCSGRKRILFP